LKAREEKLAKQADTYVEKKQRDAHAHVQHEMAKADKNAEKAMAKAAHKEANVSASSDSLGCVSVHCNTLFIQFVMLSEGGVFAFFGMIFWSRLTPDGENCSTCELAVTSQELVVESK
jgi:hypothetical protein